MIQNMIHFWHLLANRSGLGESLPIVMADIVDIPIFFCSGSISGWKWRLQKTGRMWSLQLRATSCNPRSETDYRHQFLTVILLLILLCGHSRTPGDLTRTYSIFTKNTLHYAYDWPLTCFAQYITVNPRSVPCRVTRWFPLPQHRYLICKRPSLPLLPHHPHPQVVPHNSQLNIATQPTSRLATQLAMVSIVSMAGEELLTLELKDFEMAEQLQMEISALSAVEMASCQKKNGKIEGKNRWKNDGWLVDFLMNLRESRQSSAKVRRFDQETLGCCFNKGG